MANHSLPTTASTYTNFVTELDARFDDLAIGLDPAYVTATNVPTNTLRFSSASAKWQRWNGTSWVDPVATYAIAISGNAGTVTNGVYTTGSYADPTWISSLAGSKITGGISGNAGSATVLATARTINGVSFNGSANISVNTTSNVTFNNGGSGAASGVTFNGGSAVTVSYNTVGAPSTTGSNASGTWGISITGNAATATTAAAVNTSSTITSSARVGMRITTTSNDAMYEVVKTGVVGYGMVITSDNRLTLSQTNGVGDWFKTLFSINTSGDATVVGALNVGGNVTATGAISSTGSVTATSFAAGGTTMSGSGFSGSGAGLTGTSTALSAGLGVNQTWQDVTASRAASTTYTNSTGKAIVVHVVNTWPSGYNVRCLLIATVSGVSFWIGGDNSDEYGIAIGSFVVPAGATYSVAASNTSIASWYELR